MSDLIKREDALLECCRGCRKDSAHGCAVPCPEYMNISNLPAVDAVEVVRCKDCIHSGEYVFFPDRPPVLACLEIEEDGFIRMATAVTPDYYCADGERRSE